MNYSQKPFKMVRGHAGILFEVFYKMSLIKKVVFITNVRQWFCFVHGVKNRVKPDNGGKFFGRGADNFSEAFFKRALADTQFLIQLFYFDCSLVFVDQFYSFHDQFVGLDVPKLGQ